MLLPVLLEGGRKSGAICYMILRQSPKPCRPAPLEAMRYSTKCARLAAVAILAARSALAAPEGISIESAVVFNTRCARCHEGECSGRLSFHLQADAADEHIRRHGGALALETVRNLGELLRYMKERCAFFPLQLALEKDRRWGRDTLDRLRDPDGTAYFLPLGRLKPGPYHLWLDGLNHRAGICAELIAADFDWVEHEGIAQVGERHGLRFQIEVPTEVFLRVGTQEPITLTQVELVGPDLLRAIR